MSVSLPAGGVTFRPGEAADAPAIRRLIRAARLDPTSMDWRNFTCACDASGRIIGIAQIKPYPDCQEFGSLVVVPSWRGRGLGDALIERVSARARGTCWLVCRDTLAGLYARHGFVRQRFSASPPSIRLKRMFAIFLRLFGVNIIAMRRPPGSGVAREQSSSQGGQQAGRVGVSAA